MRKDVRLLVALIVALVVLGGTSASCGSGGGGSDNSELNPTKEDRVMVDAVTRIVQGMIRFRNQNGYAPDATMVRQGGAVDPYIDGGWPENPYSGGAIRNLWNSGDASKPGDIFYWTSVGTGPRITCVLSDGQSHQYNWSWQ